MAVSGAQGPQAPKLPELLERDPYLAPFEQDFQRRYRPWHSGGLDLRAKLRAGRRRPPASGGAGSGGGWRMHPSPRWWAVPAPARLRFRPRRGQGDSHRSDGGGAFQPVRPLRTRRGRCTGTPSDGGGRAVPSPVVSLVAVATTLLASRSFPLVPPESGSASPRSRGGEGSFASSCASGAGKKCVLRLWTWLVRPLLLIKRSRSPVVITCK